MLTVTLLFPRKGGGAYVVSAVVELFKGDYTKHDAYLRRFSFSGKFAATPLCL